MAKNKQRKRTGAERGDAPAATVGPMATSRTHRVLAVGLVVYLAILATMVLFDSYTFVLKGAVIPFLLLTAVLSRRLNGFVNDWAVFLGAVVLFDSLRSLEYALTTHFELPMYALYTIDWERWLCGGAVAPIAAQQWRAALADPHWFDRFFVLIHGSHFLFFLMFGFVLWYVRREAFRQYALAMLILLYAALLLQFVVPTLPPWMVARDFALLPPTERIIRAVYNVHLPTLTRMFDVNPIAAMPSLHAAMPALCAIFACHYFGWAGLFVVAYATAAAIGVIYLGEHYLIDILAGVGLSLAIFLALRYRNRRAADRYDTPSEPLAWRRVVVAVSLVGCGFALAELSGVLLGPLPITRTFIERELVGRSRAAHYLLGRVNFNAGDYRSAQDNFALALNELMEPDEQMVIRSFLGQSAHRVGDYAAAVGALEPLRTSTQDVTDLVVLARAYIDSRRFDQGISLLHEAQRRFPRDPEPLYWTTRARFERGLIDRAEVEKTLSVLRRFPTEKSASLGDSLVQVLAGSTAPGDPAVHAVSARRQ